MELKEIDLHNPNQGCMDEGQIGTSYHSSG